MTDSKCNMTSNVHNLYRTQFMCRYVSLIGPKNALQFHINFFIHLHTTVGPCAVLKRKPVVGIVGALLSSSAAYCTPTPPPSRPLETRKLSLGGCCC